MTPEEFEEIGYDEYRQAAADAAREAGMDEEAQCLDTLFVGRPGTASHAFAETVDDIHDRVNREKLSGMSRDRVLHGLGTAVWKQWRARLTTSRQIEIVSPDP